MTSQEEQQQHEEAMEVVGQLVARIKHMFGFVEDREAIELIIEIFEQRKAEQQ